jgi:hypothetical protein
MAAPEGVPPPVIGLGVGVGEGLGLGVGEGLGLGVGEGVGVGPPRAEAVKWSMLQPSPLSHDSTPAFPAGKGALSV